MLKRLLLLICTTCSLTACVTSEDFPDTHVGNFEALWHVLDEHYCFFDYKHEVYGLDWNEVYQRYRPAVSNSMTSAQLFEVLANMTFELRDGHVNLYAAHDVARYGAWFDDYPMNFSDSIVHRYLGRTTDYSVASGLSYRILDDNIGYVRCATFENNFGEGNLNELVSSLSRCDGLIIDVRSNGGGLLTTAAKLAAVFVNEKTTVGYMCHKEGPGHSDFSEPRAISIEPVKGLRWQKPVAVLTNRRTYSAANSFVMYMKSLPNVTLVGDRTGGGAGMPFSSELPEGWSVRFSACPMFDTEMRQTELGIDPDVRVDISSDDYQMGIDTIIERARSLLTTLAGRSASTEEPDAQGQ